jgi:uncharacterized MAPEG superfamily protein
MGTELQILACAIAWGLVQLVLAVLFAIQQRGFDWAVGNRDENPALTGMGGRVDRSWRNFIETFPLFAVAVLALAVTQRGDANSILGAQLYLWGRVACLVAYALGLRFVRTLVWTVSMVGIVMVLLPLFR